MKLGPRALVLADVARRKHVASITAVFLAAAIGLRPQAGGAQAEPEDLLPQSEFDDPIGIDAHTRDVAGAAKRASERDAAALRARDAEALRFGPAPPPVRARDGEVLTSVRSAREESHRVEVELAAGLANVGVELVFSTPTDKPAEIRYRLAVPLDAHLAALEVCNSIGCRTGAPDPLAGTIGAYDDAVRARGPERAPPVAHAVEHDDERGRAIVLRAAPVVRGRDLTVRVRYFAQAPIHGGRTRFDLPARGMDPYAAPTVVRLRAPAMLDPRIAGHAATDEPASFDPWVEVPFAARVASASAPRATLWTFPCTARGSHASRCARAHVVAGPAPPEPRELVLALDVSPSTEGPARGRLLAAATSILSVAPEGTRVRVLAFAGRAQTLAAEPAAPTTLPIATLARALDAGDLGSATRFEAVWALAREWLGTRHRPGPRPVIVVVGDGGLTEGDARPFHAARRAGVEVSAVNVADRATLAQLRRGVQTTGGVVIDAGLAADAAARGHDGARLDEQVSAIFAPVVRTQVSMATGLAHARLGAFRAGHELSWQGIVRGIPRLLGTDAHAQPAPVELALALGATGDAGQEKRPNALAAVDARDIVPRAESDRPPTPRAGKACDPRGPAWRHGGVSSDLAPVALAEERSCQAAPASVAAASTEAGRGMPADPLLGMLRQRIVPVARGCFRRERAGRPDHAARAVFVFALADREIVAARVEGEIPDALRTCLLGAVDALEVPRFDGLVRVRYPLRTEREALPREIELTPTTARTLDDVLRHHALRDDVLGSDD